MKQVRYLVGAVGLAPMAIGAAAGTHATVAEMGGHAKTVAANDTLGPRRAIPDINYVNCSNPGDWLRVYHSSATHENCYANAGHETLLTYDFDYLYTGNNGVAITLYQSGIHHQCRDPNKNTYLYASSCGGTWNRGALVFLSIYPGS
jgi:hypothetical protein